MLGKVFQKALEAFAVGDAMGMPTEFMSLEEIRRKFGVIDTLLDASVSPIHSNLKRGQVTDDTEQILYLIESFHKVGKVSVEATVEALCRWIEETNADKKGYIGPSSLKALKKIQEGCDPRDAGKGGTTCGAAMRILAAALCAKQGDVEMLKEFIWSATIPTHNTNIAMEAAMALGFGYHFAALGKTFDEIISAMVQGANIGREMADSSFVGASTGERIRFALEKIKSIKSHEKLLDFVYKVIGTTMESNEVVPAAVAIFAYAKDDVWLAIRLGASVGGDTDTIAAIAGALSSLYAKSHNVPDDIVKYVSRVNQIDFAKYGRMLYEMFKL